MSANISLSHRVSDETALGLKQSIYYFCLGWRSTVEEPGGQLHRTLSERARLLRSDCTLPPCVCRCKGMFIMCLVTTYCGKLLRVAPQAIACKFLLSGACDARICPSRLL